jgi:hypothetical protein
MTSFSELAFNFKTTLPKLSTVDVAQSGAIGGNESIITNRVITSFCPYMEHIFN